MVVVVVDGWRGKRVRKEEGEEGGLRCLVCEWLENDEMMEGWEWRET